MEKKILILGAGIYQVPLIQKAKELGYKTIVCSIEGNYPGFQYADQIYYVNTTDKEAVLEIAKKEQISGICTTGTDVAVITIGYVCNQLNLPGVPLEAAKVATDKAKMKLRFKEHGVPTSSFKLVHNKEEALNAFQSLNHPVVMKIVDKSGSRGIYKVEDINEVTSTYEKQMRITNADYIVMEEFVVGHEVGIDALVQNGEVKLIIPHDKLTHTSGNVTIPVGHISPYKVEKEILQNLESAACQAINALGLDNCAVNMDVFVTESGEVSVIEAGGRAGATGIPEVISGFTGINYYEQILRISTGQPIQDSLKKGMATASVLFHSNVSGILKKVELPEMNHIEHSLDYSYGDYVHAMRNGTDRIGQAIVQAETEDELRQKVNRLLDEIVVEVIKDDE